MNNLDVSGYGPHMQERPIDPTRAPVVVPERFKSASEIQSFFCHNNRALTWDQVDDLFLRMNAAEIEESRRPNQGQGQRGGRVEVELRRVWEDGKGDPHPQRLRTLAKACAKAMGQDGPRQVEHVISIFSAVGAKHVVPAVVELCNEQLTPDKRFQFLKHRATKQKEFAA